MMQRYLRRVFLFSIILLLIIQPLRLLVNPFYANDYFRIKYDYYRDHKEKFNTVFIGSSKTFRHIVPSLYDSLLSDYNIVSFNLGAPGTFNPQLYFLLDKFIESAGDSMKYVIIDLNPLSFIAYENVNVPASYYWHTPGYWFYAMDYIRDSDYSIKRKLMLASGYTASLALKYIHLPDLKTIHGKPEAITSYWLGRDMRGYYSLDDNLAKPGNDSTFSLRRREFLRDTSVLVPRIAAATNDFLLKNHSAYLNKAHLSKVKELIRKAEAKGITVMFLISALSDDYNEQLALKEQLPPKNVIEVADFHRFPDLYDSNMIFDVGHFNTRGSRLFTKYLAEETKRILKKDEKKQLTALTNQ